MRTQPLARLRQQRRQPNQRGQRLEGVRCARRRRLAGRHDQRRHQWQIRSVGNLAQRYDVCRGERANDTESKTVNTRPWVHHWFAAKVHQG
jgi:hypothetical protein